MYYLEQIQIRQVQLVYLSADTGWNVATMQRTTNKETGEMVYTIQYGSSVLLWRETVK